MLCAPPITQEMSAIHVKWYYNYLRKKGGKGRRQGASLWAQPIECGRTRQGLYLFRINTHYSCNQRKRHLT